MLDYSLLVSANQYATIEIGLERALFVVFVYFFLTWTCKNPADYGPK